MKICRFDTKEDIYGYLEPKDGSIYIRSDMKGYDYIDTFAHEYIHWIIWRYLPKQFHKFFHCCFDMIDGFINTLNFKIIKEYYKEYYV